jgi:hypothetical protein
MLSIFFIVESGNDCANVFIVHSKIIVRIITNILLLIIIASNFLLFRIILEIQHSSQRRALPQAGNLMLCPPSADAS